MFTFYRKRQNLFLGIAGLIIFLSVWQFIEHFNLIDPILISSPSRVANEFLDMFKNGSIYPHLLISMEEFSLGFILAVIFGIILGLLLGGYRKLEAFSNPLTYALYSTPYIALLPLVILWFGVDIWAKIFIVFLGAVFPILINTISAVNNLDNDFIKLGKSFGASDSQIFRKITFPAALPFIISGIKIAIPRGLIGMIVGEFFVSSQGLGYLITFYGSTFQTSKLLAVVFIVIFISIFLTWLTSLLEKNLQAWKPEKDSI